MHYAFVITIALTMMVPSSGFAQTPTADLCTVEPRTQDELDAIAAEAATPTARYASENLTNYSYGYLASAGIYAGIQETLDMIGDCQAADDDLLLYGLFTNAFLAENGADLAIVDSLPPELFVTEAKLRRDSRVIAHVVDAAPVSTEYVFWFNILDGDWRVDSLLPIDSGAPVDIPQDAQTTVDFAVADLASSLGMQNGNILVTSVEAVDWPDSSLGCPQPDGVYLAVVTPGYRIRLSFGSVTYTYHADSAETIVRCDEAETGTT